MYGDEDDYGNEYGDEDEDEGDDDDYISDSDEEEDEEVQNQLVAPGQSIFGGFSGLGGFPFAPAPKK